MSEQITLVACECTCEAAPSQFECRTTDGRYAYLRFRWGKGGVGIGDSLDAAVGNWPNAFLFEADDLALTLPEFAARLPSGIVIEGCAR